VDNKSDDEDVQIPSHDKHDEHLITILYILHAACSMQSAWAIRGIKYVIHKNSQIIFMKT